MRRRHYSPARGVIRIHDFLPGFAQPVDAGARRLEGLDVLARAEARIDQPTLVELVQHAAVIGEMIGLAAHRAVQVQVLLNM